VTSALSRLHEQAEIIMGQSPPGNSYNSEGAGVPLLNGPTEFGPVHPKERQWTTAPTKLCEAGDILFCVRGATAGRTNVADKQYCLGRGLAAVRAKPDRFDSRFLLHVLAAGYARFQSQGVGSTFINISSEMLSDFGVPLMALDKQRWIAAILDQVDELRSNRQASLARCEEFIRADFAQLVTEASDEIKLENVAEIVMGQSPKGVSYNSDGKGTPLLNGPTEFGVEHPVEVQWTTAPTKLCARGDILFCVRGATAGRLNWSDKVYCCGRGIAAIRTHEPNDAAFIYACLEANYEYFQSRGVGSTFINISKDELGRLTHLRQCGY
jgi:type I restriction enzyme, S subunit